MQYPDPYLRGFAIQAEVAKFGHIDSLRRIDTKTALDSEWRAVSLESSPQWFAGSNPAFRTIPFRLDLPKALNLADPFQHSRESIVLDLFVFFYTSPRRQLAFLSVPTNFLLRSQTMAKKKEVNTAVDTITNIVNLVMIILGGALNSLAVYFLLQTRYQYLVNLGIVMIIIGIIVIFLGIFGFTWHLKVFRKMLKEAKENLNY